MALNALGRRPLAMITALGTGLAVPLLVLGPGAMAGVLGLVFLAALAEDGRGEALRRAARCLRTPLGLALALTLVFWLVSAVASIDPWRSLEKWLRVLVFTGVAAFLWARLSDRPEMLRDALKALVAATLVVGLFAALALHLWPPLIAAVRLGTWDPKPVTGLLKEFGSVAACLLPLALGAGFYLGGLWRAAGVLCLPVVVALLVVTDSYAGFLGLLAAAAVVGVIWLIRRLPPRPGRLVAAGAVLVVLVGVWAVLSGLPEPPYLGPDQLGLPAWLVDPHRQVIWGAAFLDALNAPWFGYGIDTVSSLPGADVIVPAFNQEYIPSHPHNWVLELLVDTGLMGLVATLAALTVLIWRFARAIATEARPMAWAGLALAGAFWGSSLVNFSIWAAWWQGTFLVLAAIVFAATRPPPTGARWQEKPSELAR
ncbi:MAG: O-antigen ligase family protein [Proteobacteria bacterium]|nr:O-antigen ligase family protein [Pseudomonadota bacterium]